MRFTKTIFICIVGFAGALHACGDDGTVPNPGPESMQFLGQIDYGCVANRGGILDCLEEATLTATEAVGDTVVLWVHFEANCCPGFAETVSYEAGELNIAVVDTVYGCRCICPFENAFRFLSAGAGEVHLRFESRALGTEPCLAGLDTTISIP